MLPELLFAGDVMQLCLPPGSETEWSLSEDQLQLLRVGHTRRHDSLRVCLPCLCLRCSPACAASQPSSLPTPTVQASCARSPALLLPPPMSPATPCWPPLPPTSHLAQEFSQQDASGPWAMLLQAAESEDALRRCREAFLVCMQHLQVFVPSELLRALDLEVSGPCLSSSWGCVVFA
jgi:hypothetical protein